MPIPRRAFLGAASAALAAPSFAAPAGAAGLALGACTYSLRKFPRDKAIAMLRKLNLKYVNVKSFHLSYDAAPADLAAACREFRDAGLEIAAGGSIDLEKDNDADIRKRFEYARAAGMPVIVVATSRSILPRIEKFAREFRIKVAIHNHGPEDKEFPSPDVALAAVRDMDPLMGVCVDVGHTIRTKVDVVKCIRDAGPRLYDVHIKDLRVVADRKSQCPVGEGVAPTTAIFRQLLAMRYAGVVHLEYEAEPEDPMPGMALSFAYMRGLLEGLRTGA